MKAIIDKMLENKMAFVIVGMAAAMALMLGIGALSNAAAPEAEQVMDEGGARDDAEQPAELTDSQKALKSIRDSYDDVQLEIDELLQSVRWKGAGGTGDLTFKDGQMTERIPASEGKIDSTRTSYAILAAADDTAVKADDGGMSEYDIAVRFEDGSIDIIHLIEVAEMSEGVKTSSHVLIEGQTLSATYTNQFSHVDMKVSGLDSGELKPLVKDRADEIAADLRDWCSVNFATATAASWTGTVSYDYTAGTAIVPLVMTDGYQGASGEEQRTVSLKFNLSTGDYEKGEF